jgi:hypothetical protein
MGWETRGGRRYYYSKYRVGPRVVSRYIGSGPVALIRARFAEKEGSKERALRTAERGKRRGELEFDATLDEVSRAAEAAAECLLLASGYHKHRGEWRRARHAEKKPSTDSD